MLMEATIKLSAIIVFGFLTLEFSYYFFTLNTFRTIPRYYPAPVFNSKNTIPSTEKHIQQNLKEALQEAMKSRKTILFWHTDEKDTGYENNEVLKKIKKGIKDNELNNPIEECGNCLFTTNKSMINDKDTAAVVFKYKYVYPGSMPVTRRLDQLYIYWTSESPQTLKLDKKKNMEFEDYVKFNATMNYRRDADIYRPYLTTFARTQKMRDITTSDISWIPETKKLWAVAIVSNCHSSAGANFRFQLIKSIISQSNGKLEAYGKCFERIIPNEINSVSRFLKPYKFYFAFENSYHCRDYITEKFFQNALHGNTVPIVWGATKEDYLAAAPPGSFIYFEDFTSIKDLIQYLDYLDKNDTAYLEYFKWRTMKVEDFSVHKRKHPFCQLCRIVHGINVDDIYNPNYNNSQFPSRPLFDDSMSKRTISSLSKWFYKDENKECLQKGYFQKWKY